MTIKRTDDSSSKTGPQKPLNVGRRRFLTAMAAGAGVSPLLSYSRRVTARRAAAVAQGLCTGPVGVLTSGDFNYLGHFTLPDPVNKFGFSRGGMTARRRNGVLTLLILGLPSDIPPNPLSHMLYEVTYPGQSITNPPVASVVRSWPDIWSGHNQIEATGSLAMLFNCYFDPVTNMLWWAYKDVYGDRNDPSLGQTQLNDDGSVAIYGPWRTTATAGRSCGYMVPIPSAYQGYVGGKRIAIGNPPHNTNAISSFGPSLHAWSPCATGTPPDAVGPGGASSIASQPVVDYPIDHRARRPTSNYKICNWNCAGPFPSVECTSEYDSRQGGGIYDPDGTWSGGGVNSLMDFPLACAWIEGANKRGVIFFGQYVDTIAGHTYEQGTSVCHMWYGVNNTPAFPPTMDCIGGAGSCVNSCVHGQVSISWSGTGPACGSLASQAWIYDPHDLIRVMQGQVNPWSPDPVSTFRVSSIPNCTISEEAPRSFRFGGAYFDPVTNQLFVSENTTDMVPIIHVFLVNA